MGYSRWDDSSWKDYSTVAKSSTREQIFKQRYIAEAFNPVNIVLRESRDSEKNPNSNPIIVALDVTGSMGIYAEMMAKEGLGTLVSGILDRSPVVDPHIMIMGVGDANGDYAPLQATQFESDIRIAEQLSDIWLEGGGRGNGYESYDLPWYFAARKTVTDSWDKRQKKGYLFTIGDECPPPGLSSRQITNVFGPTSECVNLTSAETLEEAQQKYNVFHVIVEEGDYASRDVRNVTNKWRALLGNRAISLNDSRYMPQVIISAIEVSEGRDPQEVINSWEIPEVKKAVRYSLGL